MHAGNRVRARMAAQAKAVSLDVPIAEPRRLIGPPTDYALALILVSISATGSLGAIGLWIAGHGHLGLRLLSGSVLLILGLLLA